MQKSQKQTTGSIYILTYLYLLTFLVESKPKKIFFSWNQWLECNKNSPGQKWLTTWTKKVARPSSIIWVDSIENSSCYYQNNDYFRVMDEADRFSCKKREKRMFLFFQTISAIINSMQQEKGHTNKEKLKSKFFAKRIWKIKYRSSCWEIFWFKIWPNKSAFLKLFCWSCFCVVLQLFWNSKFSLKKFPTLDRWW